MSLVKQKIRNLLNGVSQQPAEMRLPSQGEVQENALSHPALGLTIRPPTTHQAKVADDTTGYDTAFIHEVDRSDTERYRVVIADGNLHVYDALTGVEQPVYFPDTGAYLASTSGFRAVTVGDFTFIVNRDKVVAKGFQKAPAPKNEAIVYVRQADYSTPYSITIDGQEVGLQTVDSTQASARNLISTDVIASGLIGAIATSNYLTRNFTFLLNGSTIYVTRNDGKDFTISTSDGLGDNGLKAVKGKIQSFEDLPRRASNGMIVEIEGAPGDDKDNYWVQYDDSQTPGGDGVWRECVKPGTLIALDPSTMPHALVRNGRLVDNLTHGGHPHIPTISVGTQSVIEIPWDPTPPDPPPNQPEQPPIYTPAPPSDFDYQIHQHGNGVRFTHPI